MSRVTTQGLSDTAPGPVRSSLRSTRRPFTCASLARVRSARSITRSQMRSPSSAISRRAPSRLASTATEGLVVWNSSNASLVRSQSTRSPRSRSTDPCPSAPSVLCALTTAASAPCSRGLGGRRGLKGKAAPQAASTISGLPRAWHSCGQARNIAGHAEVAGADHHRPLGVRMRVERGGEARGGDAVLDVPVEVGLHRHGHDVQAGVERRRPLRLVRVGRHQHRLAGSRHRRQDRMQALGRTSGGEAGEVRAPGLRRELVRGLDGLQGLCPVVQTLGSQHVGGEGGAAEQLAHRSRRRSAGPVSRRPEVGRRTLQRRGEGVQDGSLRLVHWVVPLNGPVAQALRMTSVPGRASRRRSRSSGSHVRRRWQDAAGRGVGAWDAGDRKPRLGSGPGPVRIYARRRPRKGA